MRLGDFTHGRDNNIQLLRLLAAGAVILFHSFVFTGHIGEDPVFVATGTTNSSVIGVSCFFVLSGFLVTRSWLTRPGLVAFAAARVLRIYPALFLAVALSIALAGAATEVPWREFIASPVTMDYAWRNALAWEVRYALPGAFLGNPYPGAVNGSLWTLPVELRLYVAVAVAGMAGLLARTDRCAAALIALVALFLWKPDWLPLAPQNASTRSLALLFGTGALAYVARDRIPLSLAAFAIALAVFIVNPWGLASGLWFTLTLAYGTLVLAYHPRIQWHAYNRVGDYSYGLYVYAFPVQQTIVAHVPALTPIELFGVSFAVTLALAAISWHALERPALALKSKFGGRGADRLRAGEATP
ncbi:MAG TPA: acyltransferase [Casimicrobiaceae bacterium]|nr:acyltransferase [Casimicrobiaceae bacterium]